MKNKKEIYFMIASHIAYVVGIILCITIVGIILGIFFIKGSNRCEEYAIMSDQELYEKRYSAYKWNTFFLIFGFVTGILMLIEHSVSQKSIQNQ